MTNIALATFHSGMLSPDKLWGDKGCESEIGMGGSKRTERQRGGNSPPKLPDKMRCPGAEIPAKEEKRVEEGKSARSGSAAEILSVNLVVGGEKEAGTIPTNSVV